MIKTLFYYSQCLNKDFSDAECELEEAVRIICQRLKNATTWISYLGVEHDLWRAVPARGDVLRQEPGVVVIGVSDSRQPEVTYLMAKQYNDENEIELNRGLLSTGIRIEIVHLVLELILVHDWKRYWWNIRDESNSFRTLKIKGRLSSEC